MALSPNLHFLIKNTPGPFKLIMGWGHMLEKHGNHLEFELTVVPFEAGKTLLGHEETFKIPFEVALMGATTKYGHHVEEPRNVRFLGRFLIPGKLQPHIIDPKNAAPVLNEWRWEVVFNAGGGNNLGFVAKLNEPLPEAWTM